MPDDKQIANKDAVETDVGLVHVMPKAYQGGKLPEGSMAQEPKSPAKHEVVSKPPERKLSPAALVKKAPPKPLLPKKNRHKNRILLIVGGVVVLVLVAVVVILLLTSRPPEPEPPVAPVVTVPETPSVSTPVIPPEPTVPDEPVTPPEPFVKEPTPGRDTDSDGLSDVEERLYGSNVRLPDTDRDGFLDGNEVFHGYDPLTPDPATLLERGVVKGFSGLIEFLHPSLWMLTTNGDGVNARFEIAVPSGEMVFVSFHPMLLEPSPPGQALTEFLSSDPDLASEVSTLEFSTSKTGFPMAMTKNQMMAFVDLGSLIVSLSYETGGKETIDFLQTFQMIVGSVKPFVLEEE